MNEQELTTKGPFEVSIVALALVWKYQGLTPTEKLVLLALADYCNDKFQAWPTVGSLVGKTSLSRAAVHKALRSLKAHGLVEYSHRVDDHGNTSNLYAISRSALESGPHGVSQKQEGVHEVDEGVSHVQGWGIPETGGGYTTCTEGVHHVYPEPSYDPPYNPPREPADPRAQEFVEPVKQSAFRLQDALAILYEIPELRPQRTYKDRLGGEVSTGLQGPLHTQALQGFLDATQANPPAQRADFEVLAAWVKAGGLSWMRSKTAWLPYVCKNLPQLLDEAAGWNADGRPRVTGRGQQAPAVGPAIPAAPAQSEALQRIRSARQSEQRSEEHGRAEIPE